MTLWLAPLALRSLRRIELDLISSQISFQVQPRVFDERFPHVVLYVNDISASGTQWHGVFLAEADGENGARLTLAENAIVIADPEQGKLELHLQGGTTHEFSTRAIPIIIPSRLSGKATGRSNLTRSIRARRGN